MNGELGKGYIRIEKWWLIHISKENIELEKFVWAGRRGHDMYQVSQKNFDECIIVIVGIF